MEKLTWRKKENCSKWLGYTQFGKRVFVLVDASILRRSRENVLYDNKNEIKKFEAQREAPQVS